VVSWWKHVVFHFTKIMAVWFGGNWFRRRFHGVGSGAAWEAGSGVACGIG